MRKHIQKLVTITPEIRLVPEAIGVAQSEKVSLLLTPEQFATATGISVYTVRIWMRQGRICSLPIGVTGRVRRIPAAEVENVRKVTAHGDRTPPPVPD